MQGFKPDLTVFLDITPEAGFQRVRERGPLDRIEQESMSFFSRVHEAYRQNLEGMDNVCMIDASLPLAVVQEKIVQQLTHFLQSAQHD